MCSDVGNFFWICDPFLQMCSSVVLMVYLLLLCRVTYKNRFDEDPKVLLERDSVRPK